MPFQLFLTAFVSLFVIADPFGSAAVFGVLGQNLDRKTQQNIALKAALVAAGVLVGFSLAGNFLLDYMKISFAAFRIAGGCLVFVSAFRMVMGYHDPDHLDSEDNAYQDRSDIAVFPIAIPLLAGPGCITATMVISTTAHSWAQEMQILLAIISVQAIAYVALMGAPLMGRMLGRTGNGIISRIMGILLAALAIQYIADGLQQLKIF